jgi:hypothetical protein
LTKISLGIDVRVETKSFLENLLIFAYFSLFAKMKKSGFVSTLIGVSFLKSILEIICCYFREEFLSKLGRPFGRSREVYPVEGIGDTISIATQLYAKWTKMAAALRSY